MNIGETLLPALNEIVETMRTITGGIADFAKEHPKLTKRIAGITTGLVACKAAGLALGYASTLIKGIKGGMLAVATVWKTLMIAFAANPVGGVVTALAVAALLLIITNWEKVRKFFTTIWNKIKPI